MYDNFNYRPMNFFKTFLASTLAFIVGSFLVLFLGISILIGIAVGAMSGEAVEAKPESILKIDFSEMLTDAPETDPFAGFDFSSLQPTRSLPLLKVLRAVESAATDPNIKGIYLRMNGSGGIAGSALLEELREAIVEFKESGKFVVAYNETYTEGQYYLASAADKIYMQPEGGIDWSGLSFDLMFYKGLFDKLDLKAEVFRPTACKYKSAVEPYILSKMSDANREQMQALVNSIWGTISEEVAAARGIDLAKLNSLTDKLEVSLPEDALKYNFVDGLMYEDQMNDVFATCGVEKNAKGKYNFISLGDYAVLKGEDEKISANQVAIIYANGTIVDGEGYGKDIYGNSMAQMLAKARDNDKIKAVVLRVNSPGGSALASDVIWREMELLRGKKPVIVSMGSYAASGGYYISCPADVIVADKMTLTGSIGVFGVYFDTIDALKNKLGITLDGVKSNTSAGMGITSSLTPLERASIMRGVDKVYTTFTTDVSKGRNLSIEKVLDIAGGRVWAGTDALEIGLIDGYGGLKSAISVAIEKAGIGDDFRVTEMIEQPSGYMALVSSLFASVRSAKIRSELGMMMKHYEQIQEVTSQQGIVMYSPYKIEMR